MRYEFLFRGLFRYEESGILYLNTGFFLTEEGPEF